MKKNKKMKKIDREHFSVEMVEEALLASSNLGFYEAKNKIVQALMSLDGFRPDGFARRLVSYDICDCCGQKKPGTERSQYYMVLRTQRGENILTPLTIKQRGNLPVSDITIGFGDVKNYEFMELVDDISPSYDWIHNPIVELDELLDELSFDNRRKPALSKKTLSKIATLTEELLSD